MSLNILLDDNIFSGIRQKIFLILSRSDKCFRYYGPPLHRFRHGLKMNDFCPFLRSKPIILRKSTNGLIINFWSFQLVLFKFIGIDATEK